MYPYNYRLRVPLSLTASKRDTYSDVFDDTYKLDDGVLATE